MSARGRDEVYRLGKRRCHMEELLSHTFCASLFPGPFTFISQDARQKESARVQSHQLNQTACYLQVNGWYRSLGWKKEAFPHYCKEQQIFERFSGFSHHL